MDVAPETTSRITSAQPSAAEAPASLAALDLYALGRAAVNRRRERLGDVGVVARNRQLLSTGAWRGPRDAADAYVEEADVATLGGLAKAAAEGVRILVANGPSALAHEAAAAGLRVRVRVGYRAGESEGDRRARLEELARAIRAGLAVEAVIPTPLDEPQGLDTLAFVAAVRLVLPTDGIGHVHVVADFVALGHRLAQMALGFGADELVGPIVSERALRLGDNAKNPAMTRREAAFLLRGAGLVSYERTSSGAMEEITP